MIILPVVCWMSYSFPRAQQLRKVGLLFESKVDQALLKPSPQDTPPRHTANETAMPPAKHNHNDCEEDTR